MSTEPRRGRPRKDQGGPSARDRILQAARERFYAAGISATSMDDVATRAAVAKMTVYQHFATKEELAVAYLVHFEEAWNAWVAEGAGRRPLDSRGQILRIFDRVGAFIERDGFCGCAFVNAALEDRAGVGPIALAARDHKERTAAALTTLARGAGARQPAQLAEQLLLLIDGALIGAAMRRPGDHAGAAKKAAAALIDAATPSATSPRTSSSRSPNRP